jgi:exportin-2 (importin alpha re-exporter)
LQNIRASICEIAELFALKYSDAFPQLGSFVDGVWNMLTTVGPGSREDAVRFVSRIELQDIMAYIPQLVAKALRFLSVVVKMGNHKDMFAAPETLRAFCERIILPNMALQRKSHTVECVR